MNLYIEASKVLHGINDKTGSIKSLVFKSDFDNKKQLYALVCQTLKYREILQKIVDKTQLLKTEKLLKNDLYLACTLLYDSVIGKGLFRAGKLKQTIKRHKVCIHSECERLKVKAGVTDLSDLVSNGVHDQDVDALPRYVRVNTLKTSTIKVIEEFESDGWERTLYSQDYDSFVECVHNLEEIQFMKDLHVPDLLIFPSGTDLHDNRLCISGEIILQDKASCFPAFLLSPPEGANVIDCCAAPGNKTSHLASILQNTGKIFAFDKSKERMKTLIELTNKAGVTCVQTFRQDFCRVDPDDECFIDVEYILVDPSCSGSGMYKLDVTLIELTNKAGLTCVQTFRQDFCRVDPDDERFIDVEYILVDPSCSGSGIVSRLNHVTDDFTSNSKVRLQNLASFQTSILLHALNFPKVKKVIYSTCSIHTDENEEVVEKVMNEISEKFIVKEIMPDWPERGQEGYEHAQKCLRMSPDKALTNGFFVACFERKLNNNDDTVETLDYKNKRKLENVCDKVKKKKKMDTCKSVELDETSVSEDSEILKVDSKVNDIFEIEQNKCKTKKKKKKEKNVKYSEQLLRETEDCEIECETRIVGNKDKKSKTNKDSLNTLIEESKDVCDAEKYSDNSDLSIRDRAIKRKKKHEKVKIK